jgi:hypothetical protein
MKARAKAIAEGLVALAILVTLAGGLAYALGLIAGLFVGAFRVVSGV